MCDRIGPENLGIGNIWSCERNRMPWKCDLSAEDFVLLYTKEKPGLMALKWQRLGRDASCLGICTITL